MSRMKILALVAALICSAGAAWAANPHFIKATAVLSGNDLVVTWKEAGLGDNQNISYIAGATANATYVCVNNGGQCPNAANKVTVTGPVFKAGTFASGKNGSITASLTINPPPATKLDGSTFTCPGTQTVTFSIVTYSLVQIRDDTNGIVKTIPGTFTSNPFNCP